jgi:regulator of sigma E protease
MRVDRFSIGFGPALLRRQRGETTFQIGLIPLGGYVQIAGLNPEDDQIDREDPRAYPNRPAWQRIVTIAAGPGVNYVFAVLMRVVLNFIVGVHVPGVAVNAVIAGKPAEQSGVLPGDQILVVGGRAINRPDQVSTVIGRSQGHPVTLELLRKGERKTVTVSPAQDGGKWLIGIELGTSVRQRQGIWPAIEQGLAEPLFLSYGTVKTFVDAFRGRQKMGIKDFQSPVGIVRIMKEQIGQGLVRGLEFIAIISTLLGLFNLFPLPALDGGRLVFLGWELVTRRPVNQRVEQIVHFVGMVLLLGLLLLLVVKDLREWLFGG